MVYHQGQLDERFSAVPSKIFHLFLWEGFFLLVLGCILEVHVPTLLEEL